MNLYYTQFCQVGFLICFSFFLAIFIIFLSFRVSISKPDVEKLSAYECGFDPYEDARNVFDIRFYLVAILFILFDLEAVYFFPFSVSLSFLSLESFWSMLDFIFELIFGLIYAWEVGALEWE
jgi:NADH-quinone oxidoreductase subunit A